MTECVKIRCDDCKFVDDCVDYGWQDCKKFTPKPSEPMTEQEYLQTCNTEQLAEWFGNWHSFSCVFCKYWQNGCIYNHNQVRCAIEEGKSNKELWMEWLKQPHNS